MTTQSRRNFIENCYKLLGVGFFTLLSSKSVLLANKLETTSDLLTKKNHNNTNKVGAKILVAYATDSGSTTEVAKYIGDILINKGYNVDVKWIKDVKNITNYNALIIGSPIIYENWMPEIRTFVKDYQDTLKNIPVAYFMTCMALSSKKQEAMQKAIEYSDKLLNLAPLIEPISIGRFAGKLDYSKISYGKRLLTKVAMAIHKVKEGDYRDWKVIRIWAKRIVFKYE